MTTTEARRAMNEADEVRHVDPMRLNRNGSMLDRIMRQMLIVDGAYSFREVQKDGTERKIFVLAAV